MGLRMKKDVRDSLPRAFEGRAVLDQLLAQTESLADTEDVYGAFVEAVKHGAPAAAVIEALWEDEPKFAAPDDARRLFANLLGLHALVEAGEKVDLALTAKKPPKPARVSKPAVFSAEGPSDDELAAAMRYFNDWPKEFERLAHAFDNKQDALLTELESSGLSDEAFALVTQTLRELFAVIQLHGAVVPSLDPQHKSPDWPSEMPQSLNRWIAESVLDAQQDEAQPMSDADAQLSSKWLTALTAAAWAKKLPR